MSATTYQNLTPYQIRWIDERIHAEAWNRTKFLNFFQGSPGAKTTALNGGGYRVDGGLVKSVEEGLEEVVVTNWAKMKPGQIAGGLQDIPTQYIKLEQKQVPLMYLATKIAIPINIIHAWSNNRLIKAGNMFNEAIDHAMMALVNQVDQFICYGDDFKTPLTHDIMQAAGKFTGLFNGFQSFSGGITKDDNLTAAGDYIATYVNGRLNLENQGFDAGPYFMFSDNATYAGAEQGNNIYTSNVPWTEARWIKNEYGKIGKELGDWISSVNAFPGSDTDQNRICVTQPFISQRGKKIEPAYLLYIGYNFRIFPLWGGGINGKNMSYEAVIAWSGRLQEINSFALYHTGASAADATIE